MRRFSIFTHIKGQSAVEFALIVPILLLLTFAIIDFGRVMYYRSVINQVCRETLRTISIGENINSIADRGQKIAEGIIGTATRSISNTVDETGSPCTKILLDTSGEDMTLMISPVYSTTLLKGTMMRIRADYSIEYITPLVSTFGSKAKIKVIYYTTLEGAPK